MRQSPMEVDPAESLKEAGEEQIPEALPLMASSQVQIQNIQESTNIWPRKDTWVNRICYETKVSREEALFYLEGFKWNLDAAMEACHSKTLPEQPSQLNNKLISSLCNAAGGETREKAIACLKLFNSDSLRNQQMGDEQMDNIVDKTRAANRDKSLPKLAANLPYDLVEEILLKLPVKSLARFNLTCKEWGSLFSGHRFIYKQLVNSQYQFLHSRKSEIWVVKSGAFQIRDFGSDEVIKSMVQCEGLILCSTISPRRIVVLNGSQTRWIDKENLSVYDFFCLGHDSKNEYKVLRFNFGAYDCDCESYAAVAEIFHMTTNSWRLSDIQDNWEFTRQPPMIVSVGGNSYWIASSDGKLFVQSYNFSTEEFKPLKLPLQQVKGTKTLVLSSFRREGLSLLCQRHQDLSIDVWNGIIVQDRSIVWGKQFVVTGHNQQILYPVPSFFITEKKIVMFCEELVEEGTAHIKVINRKEVLSGRKRGIIAWQVKVSVG
ncbi:unnamed protein product [Arabidopsis arenosa]|uniref:F-box domain-containing protein n=1 Tax=Arabidopsis arenosa TaxID=38785 RepID=A0A8S2ACJ3_ARAAE|nr:unnamed protein product [Arabidopsis arenosa]CAE6019750.1 unnamed protein product [Arabidopsis arenosa]